MGLNPDGVAPLDTTRPNVARVWDYWLGGKDNFAADRELAQEMLSINPLAAQMARENRQFLYRAVGHVTRAGIRQFIDVGAGLPTADNTHEVAQRITPDAKVAYLDHDSLVVRHADALLAKSHSVIALAGDARNPRAILADPELNELIDFAQPVCVVLCGVLHFLDADTARQTVATFIDAIAGGSYVILSVGIGDRELSSDFVAAYRAANLRIFSPEEFASFFAGLEIVPPGLVPAQGWTAGDESPLPEHRQATFLVGVGRKPAVASPPAT
jgi:O-methyltransferase involved in polyketide biosynthesis